MTTNKKQNLYFSDYYINITHVQKIKCLINHLKLFSYTYEQNRKDREMSDKEDVIQALVVLLLTKGHF